MMERISGIAGSVLAAALAGYMYDAWKSHARADACTRNVAELREKFEQRRDNLRNPAVMEKALDHAAGLCAQGKYDEARNSLELTIANCRYTGACVMKKRG